MLGLKRLLIHRVPSVLQRGYLIGLGSLITPSAVCRNNKRNKGGPAQDLNMHTFSIPRSLGALLALLLSALLLSSWKDVFTSLLHTRQPSNEPVSPLDHISARSIARRFGCYYYPNSSTEDSSCAINQRDGLSYGTAKCKGGKLYEQIQAAVQGKVSLGSVSEFSAQSIDNGWRYHDDVNTLGSEWDDVFRTMSGRVPTTAEIREIGLSQSEPYKNTKGEEIRVRSPYHFASPKPPTPG